jgi:AcrR family transcriptional regulator
MATKLLAEEGIDGVRVEVVARRLGVTKGSFYWHFKDRDALLEAVLADWRKRQTLAIIARLEQGVESPAQRFQHLLRIPFGGARAEWGAGVELSLRIWARRDPRAKAALEEVDQLRLQYIENLLISCGVSKAESTARALMTYCYMRVAGGLINERQTSLMNQIESNLIRS